VPYQVHNSYIVSQIKSGFILIDQQAAHERILFESYVQLLQEKKASTQKELFPGTLKVSTADAIILREILPYINELGFDIQETKGGSFIIHGVPVCFPLETAVYPAKLGTTSKSSEGMIPYFPSA